MATTTHTAKCLGCGRKLTSAKSIAAGYGPTCSARRKARITVALEAVRSAHKPHLVEKAVEIITLGAILPLRGNRIFAVVSSDGTATYRTAPQACNCAAGLKAKHVCSHRIAAEILVAA